MMCGMMVKMNYWTWNLCSIISGIYVVLFSTNGNVNFNTELKSLAGLLFKIFSCLVT